MSTALEFDRDIEIRRCMPLVQRIARQVSARVPPSVEVDDLIQAGMEGLIEASLRFDPSTGVPFEAFARPRVRGAITDQLRGSDWLPRRRRRERREVEQATQRLAQRLCRQPTAVELSREMGLDVADVQDIVAEADFGRPVSFKPDEDSGDSFIEVHFAAEGADPGEQLAERCMRQDLVNAIQGLPERERLVMSLYYEQELNMREIAAVLDVTESRVCQIHRQAVERLQGNLRGWRTPESARLAA